MKKLVSLILACALSLSLFIPFANADETYPNPSYTLTETSIDLSGLPVYVPASAAEELSLPASENGAPVQIGVYEDFPELASLELCSASENMDTLLFRLSSAGLFVCLHEGKLIAVRENPNRGAGDPRNFLEIVLRTAATYFPPNGVVFSPDGKYASFTNFTNSEQTLQSNLLRCQLFLLDVENGEFFYLKTWNANLKDGNAAAVVGVAFDENSENLYYLTYGNINENYFSLYRYHLATGTNELLVTHNESATLPNFSYRDDSLMIAPLEKRSTKDSFGIAAYTKDLSGNWSLKKYLLPSERIFAPITRLQANRNCEYALLTLDTGASALGTPLSFLTAVNLNDFSGLDRLLIFDSEITKCVSYSYDEFSEFIRGNAREMQMLPTLLNALLTPDGKHALILFRNKVSNQTEWKLLNLETLEMKSVSASADDNFFFAAYNTQTSKNYLPGAAMLSDTLVAIGAKNSIKLYELK